MGKAMWMDRAAKAIGVAGVASVVLISVLLAPGATGASTASAGAASSKVPVLPLPGKPGYPPKLDSAALTRQEILPNLYSGFPGIPTTPALVGYPPVHQLTINGVTHNVLVFNTGFYNAPAYNGRGRVGPVLVYGHRKSTKTRDMTADQYIKLKTGGYALRRNVGALRYIYPTCCGLPHLHWHYLGAEVYAVYPAGHFDHLRRSHKQGFCMSEPDAVFTDFCGYKRPGELGQIEGMLPHTADFYDALVEGQYIDITGVPAGKYLLLNWVDSQCQLKEATYADNAATTAFQLTYPHGSNSLPTVTLGAELNHVPHLPCPAPSMNAAQAARYLQQAVVKKSGGSVTGLRFRCTRASATGFTCPASWHRGAVAYTGRFAIAHVASIKLARYATALDGIYAQALFNGSASGRHVQSSESLPLLPSVQPAHA
jgi:Lysyl oxidase